MRSDTNTKHAADWTESLRRLGFGLGRCDESGFQTVELLDLSGGPLRNASVGVAVVARLLGDGMEVTVLERNGDTWDVLSHRAVADPRQLRAALLEATKAYFEQIESVHQERRTAAAA